MHRFQSFATVLKGTGTVRGGCVWSEVHGAEGSGVDWRGIQETWCPVSWQFAGGNAFVCGPSVWEVVRAPSALCVGTCPKVAERLEHKLHFEEQTSP